MKIRNGLLFVLLLFIPFILFGCESKITLTIDPSHYDMAVGDELNINPIIKNLNGDNLVEYNIEKPEIISITNNKIKALSNGSTSVQAKVIGHDDVTTTFTVSVTLLEISGVQPLNVDETIKLELKVNGNITTDVVWKVSDENIASIDNQGQLKGKNVGTVTVSAQYQNLSKVININVVDVDKVAPTISIDSSLITNDVIINYNDDFDPLLGIKANDDRDGDITSKIVIDGEVNNHVMGEYVLTYTVADEAGNVSLPLVRKITVIWDYNVTFIGHAGCYSGLMNTEDAFINAASN